MKAFNNSYVIEHEVPLTLVKYSLEYTSLIADDR